MDNRYISGLLSLCLAALLGACSEGVELPDSGPSVASDSTTGITDYQNPLLVINDPLNSITEPGARPWVGAQRDKQASCGALLQDVAQAFITSGFELVAPENGASYAVARQDVSRDSVEYIEFCVTVEKLASYRIATRVLAGSPLENSFFVTVDEDAPDTISEPAIYDVTLSDDGSFKDDYVSTRNLDPLELVLDTGEHTLRFYYREPNTALQQIRLEALQPSDTDADPDPEPSDTGDIAQCAANTGLEEADIEALLTQYLGNAERLYALKSFESISGGLQNEWIRQNWYWDTDRGRANIMCLSSAPEGQYNLIANTIAEGRIVIGSQGEDRLRLPTPLQGTFIGNGGVDSVQVLDGGVFIGGEGMDLVSIMYDGRFEGGEGDDTLRVMKGGTYSGGAGDDALFTQFAGVFEGGVGADSVQRQASGGSAIDVESIGTAFEPLSPAADIQFVDASTDSGLIRWTPSTDERTQGYVIDIGGDALPDVLADLGEPLNSVSLRQSFNPAYAADGILTFNPLVKVYAFTELDDGSILYSDPVQAQYQTPVNADFLEPSQVLAQTEILRDTATFLDATLADDGSMVVGEDSINSPAGSPIFLSYDAALRNPVPVSGNASGTGEYYVELGKQRQYAVPRPDSGVQATVTAFSGNARERLWERDATLPIEVPFFEFQRCFDSFVTQDDWLVCRGAFQGLQAFDPSGESRVWPDLYVELVNAETDGRGARVVNFEWDRQGPFQFMQVIDLEAGTSRNIALDFSSELNSGERVSALGLAVTGDEVILTGAIYDDRCRPADDCLLFEDDRLGYFVARLSVDSGDVLAFRELPLDERPGEGVGFLTESSVVFGSKNVMTRYAVDDLSPLDRQNVPGEVVGVGESGVLIQDEVVDSFIVGSRFYLLAP